MPLVRLVVMAIAKTLSKLFGMATVTFFGRMPSRDDGRIALVGVLSLTWLPVLVAIPVPGFAETLFPFAPDDDAALRALAVATAVVIPFANGVAVAGMHNHRGLGGGHTLRTVLAGWWITPVVGVTVAATILVVPMVKAGHLARRYEVERLMVMVAADRHQRVVDHVCEVLGDRGLTAEQRDPNRVLGALFATLNWVLGHIFRRDVAQRLRIVHGHDADDEPFEVTVHAADLTIVGRRKQVSRVYAVLAEGLDEREVNLTWDDASQELEERLRGCRERLEAGEQLTDGECDDLAQELATLQLDQEEWNAVRRQIYRLERDAARAATRQDA